MRNAAFTLVAAPFAVVTVGNIIRSSKKEVVLSPRFRRQGYKETPGYKKHHPIHPAWTLEKELESKLANMQISPDDAFERMLHVLENHSKIRASIRAWGYAAMLTVRH